MKPYSYNVPIDRRRFKPGRLAVALTIIFLVVLAVLIYRDLTKQSTPTVTGPVQTNEVKSRLSTYVDFEENAFIVKLPADWQKVAKTEVIVNAKRYYPYRFQGIGQESVGRSVDIYLDEIPGSLAVSKVLLTEVTPDSTALVTQEISPQCYKYTNFPADSLGEPYATNWQGHKFICDTSKDTNTVAAIAGNLSDGVELIGGAKKQKLLLVYTDHGSAQNNSIFKDIVQGFRLR